MTNRPARSARTARSASALAVAALLAAGLQPAWAQRAVVVTQAYDPYNAEVEPLPQNCNFVEVTIPDGPPRARPVLQKPKTNPFSAASAQVVAGAMLPLGMRQVAYSYSFTRLALRIPGNYQGVFTPTSVRTVVYMGPTSAHPVASDRSVAGVDSVAWANSVTQSRGADGLMQNTWLVRNTTDGWWQAGWGMPFAPARVGMDCTVAVKPAATPINQ